MNRYRKQVLLAVVAVSLAAGQARSQQTTADGKETDSSKIARMVQPT